MKTGYKIIFNTNKDSQKKNVADSSVGFWFWVLKRIYSSFHHTLDRKKANLKAGGKPQFRKTERLNSTLCSLPASPKGQFLTRLVVMMHPLCPATQAGCNKSQTLLSNSVSHFLMSKHPNPRSLGIDRSSMVEWKYRLKCTFLDVSKLKSS